MKETPPDTPQLLCKPLKSNRHTQMIFEANSGPRPVSVNPNSESEQVNRRGISTLFRELLSGFRIRQPAIEGEISSLSPDAPGGSIMGPYSWRQHHGPLFARELPNSNLGCTWRFRGGEIVLVQHCIQRKQAWDQRSVSDHSRWSVALEWSRGSWGVPGPLTFHE